MIPKILKKGGEGDTLDSSAQIEPILPSLAIAAQLYFVGHPAKSRFLHSAVAGAPTPVGMTER